jgi:hypothetical protein
LRRRFFFVTTPTAAHLQRKAATPTAETPTAAARRTAARYNAHGGAFTTQGKRRTAASKKALQGGDTVKRWIADKYRWLWHNAPFADRRRRRWAKRHGAA